MRVLVTGATGGLGSSLLGRLGSGFDVRATSRGPGPGPGGVGTRVEWMRADLLDPPSLARVCDGVDVVVHMAALTHSTDPARYHAVNVEGTAHLVAAAEATGVGRFVHLSTRAIGARGGAYCASKALAEGRVRASAVPWVVLRPAEVYGGGGRDPIVALARSVASRRVVLVLGDGSLRLSPVFVEDVADAVVGGIGLPESTVAGRTYVLAGPEELSYDALIGRLEAFFGVPRRLRLHVPVSAARVAIGVASRLGIGAYVPDQVPRLLLEKATDSGPARRDLGFAPRALEGGLGILLRDGSAPGSAPRHG